MEKYVFPTTKMEKGWTSGYRVVMRNWTQASPGWGGRATHMVGRPPGVCESSVEQQILACEQFFLHQVQMRQPPERGAERLAQEALREETMELLIHCSLEYARRSALLCGCCNGGKLSFCYHHGYIVPAWASAYLPKQQNQLVVLEETCPKM